MANLCIAIVNFLKAGLVTFDCKTNCFFKTKLMYYFDLCESVLLIWLPLTAILGWMLFTAIGKCRSKLKKH